MHVQLRPLTIAAPSPLCASPIAAICQRSSAIFAPLTHESNCVTLSGWLPLGEWLQGIEQAEKCFLNVSKFRPVHAKIGTGPRHSRTSSVNFVRKKVEELS